MTGTFKLELSEFSFVYGYNGKMLRLTVAWKFTDAETGAQLGVATEGCLVSRKADGDMSFQFPAVPWGKAKNLRHVNTVSADLKKTVINLVENSRFAQYIGKDVPVELQAQKIKSVDSELPTSLDAEILVKEENNEDEAING